MLPLNPLYTAGELREPLTNAGVEVVVTLTPFYKRLKDIQRETPVKRIIATSIKEYLPPILRVLFTLFKEKKGGHRIRLEPGDQWFQDCLSREAGLVSAGPSPDDPAIMLMSGGTTGMPKAVVGLHRCLVAAGVQLSTLAAAAEGRAAGHRARPSAAVSRVRVRRRAEPFDSSAARRWRSCRIRETSTTC